MSWGSLIGGVFDKNIYSEYTEYSSMRCFWGGETVMELYLLQLLQAELTKRKSLA